MDTLRELVFMIIISCIIADIMEIGFTIGCKMFGLEGEKWEDKKSKK